MKYIFMKKLYNHYIDFPPKHTLREYIFGVGIAFILTISISYNAFAQSTAWTGGTSRAWNTASNWSNGVPTSTIDAIIGDASFTGPYQPSLTGSSSCNSPTIGTGTNVSAPTSTVNR